MGVMSYACSPLWLLFIVIAGIDAYGRTKTQPVYFLGDSIFPAWPKSYTLEAATLLAITLTLLYLPKLFGLLLVLRDPSRAAGYGGTARALGSAVLESLFSILLAPVMMLFQSRFVLSTLAGQTVAWNPQSRDEGRIDFATALAAHGWQVVTTVLAGWLAWHFAPTFFWWLIPILTGPVLAIPITMISARPDVGRWLARKRLLRIPEETNPPAILREPKSPRATEQRDGDDNSLIRLAVTDPFVNALHASLQSPESMPRSARVYLKS